MSEQGPPAGESEPPPPQNQSQNAGPAENNSSSNRVSVTRQGNRIQINFLQHLPQQQGGGGGSAATGGSATAGGSATEGGFILGNNVAENLRNMQNAGISISATSGSQLAVHQNGQQPQQQEGITIIRNVNGQPQAVQRGNHIRLPPGARQIVIPAGATGGFNLSGTATTSNPHNPNTVARTPLPELVPQPIPHGAAATSQGGDDDDDDDDSAHEKYKCAICYEFLHDPSSCGKCSSRFCYACLSRVASTRSSSNPRTAKCPACRADLDAIVRDDALRDELQNANITLRCSYKGCDQRLPSAAMKQHEQSCPCTPMRCKNATMGCPWHGMRKHVTHHLEHHCPVERVAGFAHQFRQTRSDHTAAIVALQQRVTMSHQLQDVQGNLVRRMIPSPMNVWDIFNLTYTATCTPAYLLHSADIWRLFLSPNAQESRAMVSNAVYMLPSVVNVGRSAIGGYRLMLSLNILQDDVNQYVDHLTLAMLSMTPAILLMTTLSCLLLDNSSSLEWSKFKFFRDHERHLLRDMATLGLLTGNVVMIEADNAGFGAVFVWLLVTTATCFFPPLLITVLASSSTGGGSGTTSITIQQVWQSRIANVVLFSLRHSAMIGFLGMSVWIDTCLMLHLLRQWPVVTTFVTKHHLIPASDGVWSNSRIEFLSGFLAVRVAMWIMEHLWNEQNGGAVFIGMLGIPWWTIVGCIVYPLLNFLMSQLTLVGMQLGTRVLHDGRAHVSPTGIREAFSVCGTLSYCIWAVMLLMVAVSTL